MEPLPPPPKVEWDEKLCECCNYIDFRTIFSGATWDDNFDSSGWSAGGGQYPRALRYINDTRETCSFCRLTYYALQDADIWHNVATHAVFLSSQVHAWLFGVQVEWRHRWKSRVEKKIWLRITSDTREVDFGKANEVEMKTCASIQLLAPDPECATGLDTRLNRMAKRYLDNGLTNLFSEPNGVEPSDAEFLDLVYRSAGRGRWVPDGQVNFDMLKNWLAICENFHGDKCKPYDNYGYQPSRVIDVLRGCVIETPADCRYFCLSYVWGGVPQVELKANTVERLLKDGGITAESSDIPQTIRDALFLAKKLGARYLWVDSCCIMQDDDSKIQEIKKMDGIYGGALLTIVAAAGGNANAGLPGARSGSRSVTQHCEWVKGRRLMTSPPAPTFDTFNSNWERRGWTLQEGSLSRRLLIFTQHQVYMRCRTTHCFEDVVCEIPVDNIGLGRFPDTGATTLMDVPDHQRLGLGYYLDIVQQISRRSFTYRLDRLDACAGILAQYQRNMKDNLGFTFGLPLQDFNSGLCWISVAAHPSDRSSRFPSWSWAAWKSAVSYKPSNDIISNMVQPAVFDDTKHGQAANFCCPQRFEHFDRENRLLKFWTTSALLTVDRVTVESSAEISTAFRIRSPQDPKICLGAMYLSQEWRAMLPDELEFICIGVEVYTTGAEKSYGLKLLCIEWIDGIAYRIQLAHDIPRYENGNRVPPGKGTQRIENWAAVDAEEKLIVLG